MHNGVMSELKKQNKVSKLLLSLSILTFILGVVVQFYNYYTFKKFNWTLVKEEVSFRDASTKSFSLNPNLDTEYEIILFYKKLIPDTNKGEVLDPGLSYNINIKNVDNILWQTKISGHPKYSVNLQGTEVVVGKFNLQKNIKYDLDLEIVSPTEFKNKDVMLSVVTNQKIFKQYFNKAGTYELIFFLMFILSFMFFMAFIILPHEDKN